MLRTLVMVLIFFLVGWEILWWLLHVKPMSPWRLKEILRSQREKYNLVDVRTAMEYGWFHIEGIPSHPDLLLNPENFRPDDKAKPVVVICMSGHRSPVVGFRLKQRGFNEVYYLSWGMIGMLIAGRGSSS